MTQRLTIIMFLGDYRGRLTPIAHMLGIGTGQCGQVLHAVRSWNFCHVTRSRCQPKKKL